MLIFLIGFMGSGKSHWGKMWSQTHQIPFVDLDTAIETAAGQTVADIFETQGENYFRELESRTLHSFSDKKDTIIACGGGTPCFHNNMQWMNNNGTTVYITSSPDAILERVWTEQDKRPLLKNMDQKAMLSFIEKKIKEREPFYKQAKITLDTDKVNENTFQQEILNS